jgi:hypothetical protein
MRKYVIVLIGLVAIMTAIGFVTAGYGAGDGECDQQSFIDEDGDGVCDNWIDADGDGINDNCLMDGSGNQYRYGKQQGNGYCSGDGSVYKGFGPRDGTGFGHFNGCCQKE